MFRINAKIFLVCLTLIMISVPKIKASSESIPQAHGCTIWFIDNTSSNKKFGIGEAQNKMEIFAYSRASKGLDRLATAKHIAKEAIRYSKFDLVEVKLFGVGAVPNKFDLDGLTFVSRVIYTPNVDKIPYINDSWSEASYSDKINSFSQLKIEGDEVNPWIETTKIPNETIAKLKYLSPTETCDLTATKCGNSYYNPELLSFVPNNPAIQNLVKKSLNEWLISRSRKSRPEC